MTILKTSLSAFILAVVLLFGLVAADETCTYTRCESRILERRAGYNRFRSGHSPCVSTPGRDLRRSFDCANNNTYHICCEDIDFESVEENQAKGFAAANYVNALLCPEARSCTKRILCEQSCRDDSPLLDYHAADEVSKEISELVHSYSDDQACYGLVHNRPAHQYNKYTRLDTEECQADCAKKYAANCQPVLDTNFTVKCYHEASRLFHKLGLSFFSVFRLTFDSFRTQQHELSVHQTIKSAFTDLHRRMEALDKEYTEWYDREVRKKRCKRSSIMLEKSWKEFLVSEFSEFDYKLANSLFDYDSLSYSQFNRAIAIINQTLMSTDFDAAGLKTPCHYG